MRAVNVEQETYIFEGEWAAAWGTQQPFPSFHELTFASGPQSVDVALKDMDGINQDGQGQPSKRVHQGAVAAVGEELSRHDALALEDYRVGHLVHVATSSGVCLNELN
ncbi:MAG TPA: hypothetical protein VGG94_04015 [Chthoniobacterales bacterium]